MSDYIDLIPENNFEKSLFSEIYQNLTDTPYKIVAKNFGDPMPEIEGDKIILMNADEQYRIPEEAKDPSVKMIFKQYCPDYYPNSKLRPIPLGPSKDIKVKCETNLKDRELDVVFLGQVAYNRVDIPKLVTEVDNSSLKSFFWLYRGFNNGLSKSDYSEIMSNAKIAICPHGTASPETFRFFESMEFGCVPLMNYDLPDHWFYRPVKQWEEARVEEFSLASIENIINKINNEEITNDKYYEYAKSVRGDNVAEYIKKEMGIR